MPTLKLLHPIQTLDNKQLLPGGTILTELAIDEVVASQEAEFQSSYSLLNHGTVNLDLHDFLSCVSYPAIFADRKQVADIFGLIEQVRLHPAMLESLDYFKKYDIATYRHILIVFALSILLAREMVSDQQEVLREAMTGPSHDFGKTCVPPQI